MNWCSTCCKNVQGDDNGGRNSKSLWCPNCGSRVDGSKPRYTAKYFGQLQKDGKYTDIVYSLEYNDETIILRKDQLETFAKVEGIDLEFQEQRYVVESLRDLNYFTVMLTDLRELYINKKISGKQCADLFNNLMVDVLGYSMLDRASQWFANYLEKKDTKPNFYVREPKEKICSDCGTSVPVENMTKHIQEEGHRG